MLTGHVPEEDRRVRLLLDSGRVEECENAFDQLIASAPNVVDPLWHRSIVIVHRAMLAWRLGRIPLALELAADAWAELDVDSGDKVATAHTLSMLGYIREAHNAPALDMLGEAVQLARADGNRSTLSHCLLREGTAQMSHALSKDATFAGRFFTKALELFDEAVEISPPGAVRWRSLATSARVLAGLGELAKAEENATVALRESGNSQDVFSSSIAEWALGTIRRKQGRLEEARTHASLSVEGAEKIRDTFLIMRFSRDLGSICEELGDPAGESVALRRTIRASHTAINIQQQGLAQALEQRKLAVQAQRAATAAQAAAMRDPLTGLTNRLGLERRAPALLQQTAAQGRVPWLLLIDIDWFKEINDDSGHATGDMVLQQVADVLQRECRADDLVCRWAGDEFVVLLTEAGQDAGVTGPAVAERIRFAIENHEWPAVSGHSKRSPTASIGVSAGPAPLEDLFGTADVALYRAKQAGRNRVEVDRTGPDTSPRPR